MERPQQFYVGLPPLGMAQRYQRMGDRDVHLVHGAVNSSLRGSTRCGRMLRTGRPDLSREC